MSFGNDFDFDNMYEGATEPSPGLTFIGPGTHQLALAAFYRCNKPNEAPKFRIDAVVREDGQSHKAGEIVTAIFKPYENPFPGAGAKEAGRMLLLVKALEQNPDLTRAEVAQKTKQLLDPSQPGRGMQFVSSGYSKEPKKNPDGSPKLDKHGKPKGPFTIVSFLPSDPFTAEDMMANRAKIETMPQIKALRIPGASKPAQATQPAQQEQAEQPAQAPATAPSSW